MFFFDFLLKNIVVNPVADLNSESSPFNLHMSHHFFGVIHGVGASQVLYESGNGLCFIHMLLG